MGRLVITANRTAVPGHPRAGGDAVAGLDARVRRDGFGWCDRSEDRIRDAAPRMPGRKVACLHAPRGAVDCAAPGSHPFGRANCAFSRLSHLHLDLADFVQRELEGSAAMRCEDIALCRHPLVEAVAARSPAV